MRGQGQTESVARESLKDRAAWRETCEFFVFITECIPKTLKLGKQKAEGFKMSAACLRLAASCNLHRNQRDAPKGWDTRNGGRLYEEHRYQFLRNAGKKNFTVWVRENYLPSRTAVIMVYFQQCPIFNSKLLDMERHRKMRYILKKRGSQWKEIRAAPGTGSADKDQNSYQIYLKK